QALGPPRRPGRPEAEQVDELVAVLGDRRTDRMVGSQARAEVAQPIALDNETGAEVAKSSDKGVERHSEPPATAGGRSCLRAFDHQGRSLSGATSGVNNL